MLFMWPQTCHACALSATNLGELALLINEGDDVEWFLAYEVKYFLVVLELNAGPVDPLLVVLMLLQLEDVPDKELLQVLVAVVDAHLLKAVEDECLEAKDIQHSNAEPLLPLVLQRNCVHVRCRRALGTWSISMKHKALYYSSTRKHGRWRILQHCVAEWTTRPNEQRKQLTSHTLCTKSNTTMLISDIQGKL